MSFGPRTLIAKAMVSLEAEDVSGRTSAEIERVLYARVSNFDFLERAAGADRQEQWSIKIPKTDENAGSGSIRVRKVINLREPGAAVQYILASKLDIGTKGGAAETPEPSTVDQFNIFKYFANKGMLKDRYYFPIEGSDLQWEVDCFTKPGEMYHEWVKIDLEKWPRGKELPQLPFSFSEVIDGSEGEITEENKPKIDNLYETIFLTKNTNEPLVNYAAEEGTDAPLDEEGQAKENDTSGGTPDAPPANPDDTDADADSDADADADADADGDADADADADKGNTDDADAGDEDGKKKTDDDAEGDGTGETQATPESFHIFGRPSIDNEAFSSAGQVLTQMIPILGPLTAVIYGTRGGNLGGISTNQHTEKTTSHIDKQGRKTSNVSATGSFNLSEMADAKDYIHLLETAAKEVADKKKGIDRIELTLWPQKDGKFPIFDIKTNREGETSILTANNPGKLKWFSMSMAGKRVIKLNENDVERFKFNGRTISVPFDGDIVEFDVGQLRSMKYHTTPKNDTFDIVEFNFDK